jgi:uncharacterized protein YggE
MRKTNIFFACVLGALALSVAPSALAAGQCSPRSVSVSGSGSAEAAPGEYVFHVGITHRDTDVQTANAAVDKAAASAVRAARNAGVAKKDIRSTEVSISPVYKSDKKADEPQKFQVTREVTITLRDPSHYAKLTEGLIKAGVNRITNIEARPEHPKALADKALSDAVADARHKAKLIAHKLGVRLGPATRVSVSGHVRPMPRMMAMKATSAGNAAEHGGYEHGQIETHAEVSTTFELSPSGCSD